MTLKFEKGKLYMPEELKDKMPQIEFTKAIGLTQGRCDRYQFLETVIPLDLSKLSHEAIPEEAGYRTHTFKLRQIMINAWEYEG